MPGFLGPGRPRKEKVKQINGTDLLRSWVTDMQPMPSQCAAWRRVGRLLAVCEEAVRRRKSSVRRGEAGGFSAMARLENHRNVAAAVVCAILLQSDNLGDNVPVFFNCRVETL